ncbi:DUF4350 domain-containing protein [Luteimonas sp. FCS-9]|uniref:DUF4350 domain-containing protein n=1 Tax=Luteimonas sp. FCS-9 TaxID=1547516 RepID=UPI00063E9E37|nr:DUF4350 domain-containing protein [Luteimonas sp. FCS-9]KLI99052.1 hypothetical protein WQ56_13625 [Luteimonas sp. FCS-9]
MAWPLRIGLGLLAALALALGVAWFLHTHERVDEERTLPPRGEAAYNPLYALRQALREAGVPAQSRQRLRLGEIALATHDTLVVYGDPGAMTPGEIDTLVDWVVAGGHLVVRTPPPRLRDGAARPRTLLGALGVQLVDGGVACEHLRIEGQPPHTEFCSGRRFLLDEAEPWLFWGDPDDGLAYARFDCGDGWVDVLADMDFLANDALREGPHWMLARQVLAPNWGRGTVHLVYAASVPPLWYLLLTRGWMAWGPLLLALAAWLWMRTQRLGPLLPSPPPARRALLEHVRASGEHLVRYGRAPLLHDAVRAAFLARLRRRDPLAASLEGEARDEAIAARTGLTPREVRQALLAPKPDDAAALRQRIARLIQMRSNLTRPRP